MGESGKYLCLYDSTASSLASACSPASASSTSVDVALRDGAGRGLLGKGKRDNMGTREVGEFNTFFF